MNDIDLILNDVPDDDHNGLVGRVNEFYNLDINKKVERAATWMQSLHFYVGNQWIRYSNRDRKWEQIPFTATNRNIDRPVANHIMRYVTINVSAFTSQPTFIIDPNSDEPEDKTAAKVGEVVQDFLFEDLGKTDMYLEAALWGLICGTVFRKSFKDYSGRFLKVPALDPSGNEVIDPMTGIPGTIDQPLKRVNAEIISPFNIAIDAAPKRFKDVGAIMESSVKRLAWIKDTYNQNAPGFTGNASEVKEEQNLTYALTMGESLKNIVEMNGNNYVGFDSNVIVKDSNVVKETYVKPTSNFPQGRMIVVAGDQLLYVGPSPYFYQGGKVWHPYTQWNYMRQPGSVWGLSLVQQLIPSQRRINAIDALLAYNRKTVAVGTWLIPSGANIPDGQLVGVPGQNVTYDAVPGGARPERVPGVPLPNQVVEERGLILQDMDLIANSADLRSGQNPKGVTTLGQLQILTEQAQQSISKIVEGWEKFLEESERLDLLNFQDCYKSPDNEIARGLAKLSKDISSYDWEKFSGADLRDNTAIRVEKGSTISRSRALRQDTILKLVQLGLLGDIMSDPIAHKTFLEEFGLSKLFNESNVDVKKAEKAIEMMMEGTYPPVDELDNPDIQLLVLARYMKDPKFMTVDDNIKILFNRRKEEYLRMLAETAAVPDNAAETIPGKIKFPVDTSSENPSSLPNKSPMGA